MTAGANLIGGQVAAPRKRGRPPGSTNKRPAQLQGFIAARYGATAAQQSAAICMVTPAELKAAGGSMVKAQVAKAAGLVDQVREAQQGLDDRLRAVVREELEILLLDVREAAGEKLRQAVTAALKRVRDASSPFGVREALELMARERAALLPYTDQKQPLALDVTAKTAEPSVVVMGAPPALPLGAGGVEKAEVFEGVFTEVSPSKSHGDGQASDLPGLLTGPATD